MNLSGSKKTTFFINKGHFKFICIPFNLKGTPIHFQRLMNKLFVGLKELKVFVYLDDIFIYAKDLNDHSQKLTEIFQRLFRYNLKL